MIILNEVKAAEKCLNNGLIEGKPLYTISILAKYYYHHCGYKKKQIEELLFDYLKKYYPRYEYSEFWWEEKVESVAKKAREGTLYEIEGISITKAELAKIKELNNKVLERLLFTMLCLAKFCNAKNPANKDWVNFKYKDIFKLARISCNNFDRCEKTAELIERGYLELSKRIDKVNFRITFVDDDSEQVLFITESDFRELGYVYRQYCGEKFIRCAECDILMRPNKNNTRRYCKDCASYEKQDYKFVTCSVCGKEFRTSNVDNRADKCPECQYKEKYNIVGEQTKVCVDCGKEFTSTNSRQIRCDECQYKYNHSIKGEQTKVCIDCGKEFTTNLANKVRCDSCQKEENKRIKREWWAKNKNKSNK